MNLYLRAGEGFYKVIPFFKNNNIYSYISLIQKWHHNSKLYMKSDKDANVYQNC